MQNVFISECIGVQKIVSKKNSQVKTYQICHFVYDADEFNRYVFTVFDDDIQVGDRCATIYANRSYIILNKEY